jgi:hypothetical protein
MVKVRDDFIGFNELLLSCEVLHPVRPSIKREVGPISTGAGSGDSHAQMGLYYTQAESRFDRKSKSHPSALSPLSCRGHRRREAAKGMRTQTVGQLNTSLKVWFWDWVRRASEVGEWERISSLLERINCEDHNIGIS